MEPQEHRIPLGSHDFCWWEWGDPSDPPLVFLHGMLTNGPMYGALLERFAAASRRVIALDQRGHGDSAHPGEYGTEAWLDDLDALWAGLDLGTVDVVGHSMGGGHGTAFAARRPDAVRRLAVLDQLYWSEQPEDEQMAYWMQCAALAPEDGFVSADDYIATACAVFPRSEPDAVARNVPSLVRAADERWTWRRPTDPEVFTAYERTEDEWRAVCAAVTCPVLIARAAESELFAGPTEAVAAAFPNGTTVDVPDSGHMIMWENVPAWADATLGFLSEA